jgi:hypothetical protein
MDDNFLSDKPSKKHNQNHRLGQYKQFTGIVCCGVDCPACRMVVMIETSSISVQLAALIAESSSREMADQADTFDPPTEWEGDN